MPTNVTLTNYIWMDKHVAAFADSQEVQYTENIGELFDDIANAIRTI